MSGSHTLAYTLQENAADRARLDAIVLSVRVRLTGSSADEPIWYSDQRRQPSGCRNDRAVCLVRDSQP